MTIALSFTNFGFRYSGTTTPALTGVNLAIPSGRLVSVIGAQASGKTTFLRAAAGLFENLSERGNLLGPTPGRAEGQLVGAFFDGYVQVTLAVETVREEIGLPLSARFGRTERVEHVARELGIEHLLDRDVTALSGGEEKLVGIAAALAIESYLYVLDEPFEQLDIRHHSAVIRAMKARARAGSLVLVSSGSVDTALNISDMCIVFDGATWRQMDKPTYADLANIPGLASSSTGQFVTKRGGSLEGVRRFRDAICILSEARDLL